MDKGIFKVRDLMRQRYGYFPFPPEKVGKSPPSTVPALLPSPLGFPAITVRSFVVAVFLHSSFFGFSAVAGGSCCHRRPSFCRCRLLPFLLLWLFFRRRSVFFRRRPGPSSVAAPVLPPLSRYFCPQPSGLSVLAASFFPGLHEKSPEAALPGFAEILFRKGLFPVQNLVEIVFLGV
ncbi:MAG: hypothetical protein ACLRMJ_01480 [Alistipes finegoldii]